MAHLSESRCRELEAAIFRAKKPGGFFQRHLIDTFKAHCTEGPDMASGFRTLRPSIVTAAPGAADSRRASKLNAHTAKLSGVGSSATGPRPSATGDLGAQLGGLAGRSIGGDTGEDIGRILGTVVEGLVRGGDRPQKGGGGVNMLQAPAGAGPCQFPAVKVGDRCVDLTAAAPGGRPLTTAAGGSAVMGGFGLPAMAPVLEQRVVRRCGPGMVLGKDNLCYPKAILSRRSKFRKHRAAPRPPISAADVRAIRRAARAKDRVADLGRDVGLHVSKTRGKSRKQIENEIKLELMGD